MSDSERKPPVGGGRPSLLGNGIAQATTKGASGGAEPTRVLEQLGGPREQPSRFKRAPIALALAGVLAAAGALYWNTAAQAPASIATQAQNRPAPDPAPSPVVAKVASESAPATPTSKSESAEGEARVFVAEDASPAVAKAPVAVAAASAADKGTASVDKAAPPRSVRAQPARLASADKAGARSKRTHAEQVAASSKSRPPRSETARKSARPDPDPDTDLIAAMLRRTDDARGSGMSGIQRSRPAP